MALQSTRATISRCLWQSSHRAPHTTTHTRARKADAHTHTIARTRPQTQWRARAVLYTSTVWFPVCFTGVPVILAPPHPTPQQPFCSTAGGVADKLRSSFHHRAHTHRMTHSRTHIHTHAHILHSYSASSLRCFNVVPETPQSARGEKETHFTFNFWQPIPRTGHRQQHTTFSHTAATAASSSCRRDFQFMLAVFNFTHERH